MNLLLAGGGILSAAITGYALGVAAGQRAAWRHARAYLAEHGRLPLAPTVYERPPAPRAAPPRRRRSDRGHTALGVTIIALILAAGWIVEALAAALEALI